MNLQLLCVCAEFVLLLLLLLFPRESDCEKLVHQLKLCSVEISSSPPHNKVCTTHHGY